MNGSPLHLDDLIHDPDFYPHTINLVKKYGEVEERLMLTFRRMSEKKFRAEPHLDDLFRGLEDVDYVAPLELVLKKFESMPAIASPVTHYVFHHGFCGSTLLTRAIESLGGCMVIREPLALTLWSRPKRLLKGNLDLWRRGLRLLAFLLARNYRAGDATVIKPNDDNNVIADLVTLHEGSRGLFVYNDLQDFIVAVLSGEEDRSEHLSRVAFIQRRVSRFASDSEVLAQYVNALDLQRLSVVESIALVWLIQRYTFVEQSKRAGAGKVCSIQLSDLLERTVDVLTEVSRFFQLSVRSEDVIRASEGDAMRKHAKQGSAYSRKEHQERRATDLKRFQKEIRDGLHWRDKVEKAFPFPEHELADIFSVSRKQ